ncbi:MAG: TonB-dependent receptor, partial [Flavobacteriales bacterium]|nr:TonB-dependent receptor [Flavobacteriales bacterium]
LSGVYDVKIRAGNNEKFESAIGFGLIGTDLTLEGPFKKGYAGSYLINYRYSVTAIIDALGLVDIGGVPKFQDAIFKVVLPTKKAGTFSFFGLGGFSNILMEDVQPDIWATPTNGTLAADIREDFDKATHLFNTGMNHILSINDHSFLKTSLSYSSEGIEDEIFEKQVITILDDQGEFLSDSVISRMMNFQSRIIKSTYRGALTYSNKLNAKNKIQIGTKHTLSDYDYDQSFFQDSTASWFTAVDFKEDIGTVRNFISWKHRLTEDITIISGFHNMNVVYNNKSTLEPRLAMKWKLNGKSSVNAGYGMHSNMESIHNYFTKLELEDGSVIEPNKDLGLLKAHHFVAGYENRFTENLMFKVEVYYQALYDLPVGNNDTSYYATINEGLNAEYIDLVNEGTGKNYGVELTLERFLNNNYYFLINGSVFNSTYKSLDGTERNTAYNGNYLANVLIGKEFEKLGKKKNQTLSLNFKGFVGGGKKIIPLLRDADGNLAVDPANNRFWDHDKAYEVSIEDIYTIVLSASYKFNKPKATHEVFLSLDNITNNKGKLAEFYDASMPGGIGYVTQFGFFPNLMYRVYF